MISNHSDHQLSCHTVSQGFNSRRRAPVHHHPVVRWLRHRQQERQCRDRRKRHVPDCARMGRQLACHCRCTRIRRDGRVGHLSDMLTRLGHHHADNGPTTPPMSATALILHLCTSTLAICRLHKYTNKYIATPRCKLKIAVVAWLPGVKIMSAGYNKRGSVRDMSNTTEGARNIAGQA